MTALEFLGHVKSIYANWVRPGSIKERSTHPGLCHNVSNTVRVKAHEWDGVAKYIYDHQESFSGVSFIDYFGDRDYAQAPFTSVYNPEEQFHLYGKPAKSRTVAALAKDSLKHFTSLWRACELALGEWGDGPITNEQADWAVAMKAAATKYLEGDVRKMSHCLKDVFNWDLYVKLKDSYQKVDYSLMVEKDNGVKLQGEIACGAGGCET